jgi:predicted DNA-binding ArsR family transcriptional regulator
MRELAEVERWADIAREAVKERDAEVRKASKAGATLRELAEALEVSTTAVSGILKKRELPQGTLRARLGMGERMRQVGE